MSFKRFESGDIVDSLDPIVGTVGIDITDTSSVDLDSGDEDSVLYASIRNLVYPYNPSKFDDKFSPGTLYVYSIKREAYKERLDPETSEVDGDLIEDEFELIDHTESGRLYEKGNVWFLPDVALILKKDAAAIGTVYSKETLGVKYFFIRGKNNEFNYTQNPTFLDSNGDIKQDFIYTPKTYATTVGLYNDMNELLAVAKLSQPLPKDFNNEFLIRAKLGF